jgi:hypothetical protein
MKAASSHSISIELKVKNNDKSTSPFVTNQCSAQLKYGRFSLMQLYKLAKTLDISEITNSLNMHENDGCNSNIKHTKNAGNSNNTNISNQYCLADKNESNSNKSCNSNRFYRNRRNEVPDRVLKAAGISTHTHCEWGHFTGISAYDPSDLLSNNKILMKKALNALYNNPQNNLRVSANCNHIYGGHKTGIKDKDKMLFELQKFFGTHYDINTPDRMEPFTAFTPEDSRIPSTSTIDSAHHDENGTLSGIPDLWSRMIDIVTSILSAETVMVRIRSMQYLDILDIEGAACVLSRLESLTGGVVPAQERLLSEMTVPFESSLLLFIHTRILKKKLYESNTTDDSDVCNDIKPIPAVITPSIPCNQPQAKSRTEELIEALDNLQISEEMNNKERNLRLIQAHRWVSTLKEIDCAVLLKV